MQLLDGNGDNDSKFSGKDSEIRFLANLESQPADWLWRTRPVHYTLNSQRYRAAEWDSYDWSNTILVFGCSLVFGTGVDDSETLPYYLSKITGFPTANLGMGASGLFFHMVNSTILKENKINPKAVVYVWPDRSRQIEFGDEFTVAHHGAWKVEQEWLKALILNDTHNRHWAKYLIRNMRTLWDCPIVEASWYDDMCELTGAIKLKIIDHARDCSHPGPESLKEAANLIANKLVLKE